MADAEESRYSGTKLSVDCVVLDFKRKYEIGEASVNDELEMLLALAEKYQEGSYWRDQVQAQALWLSCYNRTHDPSHIKAANRVQINYLSSKGVHVTEQQIDDITEKTVGKLEDLRHETQDRCEKLLQEINEWSTAEEHLHPANNQAMRESFCDSVWKTSTTCTERMVAVTGFLTEQAVQICGEPPCRFAACAHGSISRGECTPYSDLEFLFLIAQDSTEIKDYFHTLAITMYFLIGNLRETDLWHMGINELTEWFYDSSISGFKIDGFLKYAGNIPTGSGYDGEHKFICTVEELVERYRDKYNDPAEDQSMADLSTMLSSTVCFFGDESLHTELKQRISEIQPNSERAKATEEMLKIHLKRFDFLPEDEAFHQVRDLKADFFRFPALLAYDLKIWQHLEINDSVAILRSLEEKGVISKTLALGLRFLLCSATFIRISVYSYYRSQRNDVTVLPELPGTLSEHEAETSPLWRIPKQLLLHMCVYMTAIKHKLKSNTKDLVTNLATEVEFKPLEAVAYTSLFSNDFELAQEAFERLYVERCNAYGKEHREISLTLNYLGNIYYHLSKYEQAKEILKRSLEMDFELFGRDTPCSDTAYTLNQLGLVHRALSEYDLAEKRYQQSLEMLLQLFGHDKPQWTILRAYNNLGQVYYNKSKFGEAEESYLKALKMVHELHGTKSPHRDEYCILNSLAQVYSGQSKYHQAAETYQKVLKIQYRLYGDDTPHNAITVTLNNLGDTYHCLGDYELAKKMLERSLNMAYLLYSGGDQGIPHSAIILRLNTLSKIFASQHKYQQAEETCRKSLDMADKLHGINSDCLEKVIALGNLAALYRAQDKLELADETFKKVLEMQYRLYGRDTAHNAIATTLNNLGELYQSTGRYDSAEDYYQSSLDMANKLFGANTPHEFIIEVRSNIAYLYFEKYKLDLAEEEYKRAVDMAYALNGRDSAHPKTANLLYNLAIVYLHQSKNKQAEETLLQVLNMRSKIHGTDTPNSSIATSLNELGKAYRNQDQFDLAEETFKKCLAMWTRLYGETPHVDKRTTIHCMAQLYERQSKFDLAEIMYKRSFEMAKKLYTSPDSSIFATLYDLGRIYTSQSKYELAEQAYKLSLDNAISLHGVDAVHSDIYNILSCLCAIYCKQGKYDLAEEGYKKCWVQAEELYGSDPHNEAVSTTLNQLTRLYIMQTKYDLAEEVLIKLLAREQDQYGSDVACSKMYATLNNLGYVCNEQSKFNQAEEYYKKSLDMAKRLHGSDPTHTDVLTALNGLGKAYFGQRKFTQAEITYKECLEIVDFYSQFGLSIANSTLASILKYLAEVYAKQGKSELAEEILKKAADLPPQE